MRPFQSPKNRPDEIHSDGNRKLKDVKTAGANKPVRKGYRGLYSLENSLHPVRDNLHGIPCELVSTHNTFRQYSLKYGRNSYYVRWVLERGLYKNLGRMHVDDFRWSANKKKYKFVFEAGTVNTLNKYNTVRHANPGVAHPVNT